MLRNILVVSLTFISLSFFLPVQSHSGLVVLDSFDSPDSGLTQPHGLAFDGEYLWCAGYDNDTIYKLDASGNIISAFDSPGSSPTGLTFDGNYLWSADDGSLRIYKIDTSTGEVIESFEAPGTDSTGLTFDGTYLWNVECNNSAGTTNWGDDNYTINVDSIEPSIILNYPSDYQNISNTIYALIISSLIFGPI